MSDGRADGDGDVKNVSPPRDLGLASGLGKALTNLLDVGFGTIVENHKKFVFQPTANEIVWTKSVLEGLSNQAECGIRGSLAIPFAHFLQIIDGDA